MPTARQRFDYTLGGGPKVARDPRQYRKRGVGVEIKPHTQRGISDGVTQWRGRTEAKSLQRHLVTYRPKKGVPSRYEVLISDKGQLQQAIDNRTAPSTLTKWRVIGEFTSTRADKMIPLADCPPALGKLLEAQARQVYASWVGVKVPNKSPSASGMDARHELAEFLRELAEELEHY